MQRWRKLFFAHFEAVASIWFTRSYYTTKSQTDARPRRETTHRRHVERCEPSAYLC